VILFEMSMPRAYTSCTGQCRLVLSNLCGNICHNFELQTVLISDAVMLVWPSSIVTT